MQFESNESADFILFIPMFFSILFAWLLFWAGNGTALNIIFRRFFPHAKTHKVTRTSEEKLTKWSPTAKTSHEWHDLRQQTVTKILHAAPCSELLPAASACTLGREGLLSALLRSSAGRLAATVLEGLSDAVSGLKKKKRVCSLVVK